MSRIHVKCNPSENSIQGLYTPGDEVLVLCDATDADFTITMPDSYSSEDTEFGFSKTDSSLNVIRIEAIENQSIMGEDFQELTECGDLLRLNSDSEGGWW